MVGPNGPTGRRTAYTPGEYVRLFSDAVEDSRDVKSYCSSCCGYDALQGRLSAPVFGG